MFILIGISYQALRTQPAKRTNQSTAFLLPPALRHSGDLLRRLALLQQPFAFRFQCAGGAHAHALAAEHACCFGHTFVEERTDRCLKAAPVEIDGERVLRVVGADLHTSPA